MFLNKSTDFLKVMEHMCRHLSNSFVSLERRGVAQGLLQSTILGNLHQKSSIDSSSCILKSCNFRSHRRKGNTDSFSSVWLSLNL